MNLKRPFVPGFLKKAEQKLLLNEPAIWSTRAHLVIYYGIVSILILAFISALEPMPVRGNSTEEIWMGFCSVVAAIGGIVWLIYLLRFNVFKQYGNTSPRYMLTTFLLYFISIGVMVLFIVVQPIVESIKANMAFSDTEIVNDVNDINIKIGQLNYASLYHYWDYDTVALWKDAPRPVNEGDAVVAPERLNDHFLRLDSSEFFGRIATADSVKKLSDTMYLRYSTPNYQWVSSYSIYRYAKTQILTSFELYKKIVSHLPNNEERKVIGKELVALINKYDPPQRRVSTEKPPVYTDLYRKINDQYRVNFIENSISNILSKKHRWDFHHLDDYARVFYYFTLCISLLLLLFRHNTLASFFLTLLTGIVLLIITAMIMSFTHHTDELFVILLIIYTVIFFLGSLAVWKQKHRSLITGIFINLFVVMLPILPLLLVSAWYDLQNVSHYHWANDVGEYVFMDKWSLAISELVGGLLLLTLLPAYIYKLYRRWYSLPQD